MKKIAILSTVNIKHMTLISLYINFFEKHGIDFDIIYIDKYDEEEKITAKNKYKFDLSIDREWSLLRKLYQYYKFKSYAKRIIKRNDYDFLIVWNSFTALMFFDLLIFKFNKKYCINIRDYTYERNRFIFYFMKKVIRHSSFNTISSEAFKTFLPNNNYIHLHSFNSSLLKSTLPQLSKRKINQPLRITFIGYVRFFDKDKQLIDALGNDERFILQYFGEGSEILSEYAKTRGYNNIICKGRFEPDKTGEYLEQSDIINNLYGNNNPSLDYALSIKLYYAVYMHLPILVFSETYMEKVAYRYNMNITINKIEKYKLADLIFNSYHKLDQRKLLSGTKEFRNKIFEDNQKFYSSLENLFL